MVKMADINKRLLTASDGIPAPQHKVKGESDFEFTEGSSGAQHTKIVDSSGQPISIDEELKSIKRTQAEILDRLDNGIDTRLTGSNVVKETLHKRDIYADNSINKYIRTPEGTKYALVYLDIHGVSGNVEGGGAYLYLAPRTDNNFTLGFIESDTINMSRRGLVIVLGKGATNLSEFAKLPRYNYVDMHPPTLFSMEIRVDGEFSEEEGIDCESYVEWHF